MKQIRDKVAGLDVHRDTVVAATRITLPSREVEVHKERFSTTRAGLAELSAFLLDAGVATVAMEATGVYWRPVYYALEGLFAELWLCNAAHVKNVPGRKSDLSDAEWLADVAAHGMVKASFVPPPEVRELREITRYRKTQIDARVKEIQRLEKVLQDAGVKLTSVASTVWSASYPWWASKVPSRATSRRSILSRRRPLASWAKTTGSRSPAMRASIMARPRSSPTSTS